MEWLAKVRIELGMTQEEVASKAEIARTTYAMIEQGKRQPSVVVSKKISEVLNLSWTKFFEDTKDAIHQKCL
jgi:DNA-binding XRE family transcriptional regulator